MKKLLFALIAVAGLTANAAFNEITPKLGFWNSTLNTGVDFNHMYSNTAGFGGYLFLQTESTSNSVPAVTALGANMKFMIWTDNTFNFYVSPGFGILMMKDAAGDNQTGIGPSLKIGSQYWINNTMAIGLERNAFANWFNNKLGNNDLALYQAAFSIRF